MALFKGHDSGIACPECCWMVLYLLLLHTFCQDFCEALTGSSGSLLKQSCVGK